MNDPYIRYKILFGIILKNEEQTYSDVYKTNIRSIESFFDWQT